MVTDERLVKRLQALMNAGRIPRAVTHVTIAHDPDCPAFGTDRRACTCTPDIIIDGKVIKD